MLKVATSRAMPAKTPAGTSGRRSRKSSSMLVGRLSGQLGAGEHLGPVGRRRPETVSASSSSETPVGGPHQDGGDLARLPRRAGSCCAPSRVKAVKVVPAQAVLVAEGGDAHDLDLDRLGGLHHGRGVADREVAVLGRAPVDHDLVVGPRAPGPRPAGRG